METKKVQIKALKVGHLILSDARDFTFEVKEIAPRGLGYWITVVFECFDRVGSRSVCADRPHTNEVEVLVCPDCGNELDFEHGAHTGDEWNFSCPDCGCCIVVD